MILLAAHVAAGVALLIWSVRLIRTGVERAFLTQLRRWLRSLSRSPYSAAAGGGLAAMLMQSSTAVALIGAGFATSGMLALKPALALLLGADLGSAVMARVLLLPVDAIVPFVLLAGILTFLKSRSRRTKQIGRIIIGFALVLLALQMVRAATVPVAGNPIVRQIAAYFDGDLLSAFAIGALLAWLMHSSLAAVLTFAAFAAGGLTTGPATAALVVGANLGGAAIPFLLMSGAERPARVLVTSNLLARGSVTLAALLTLLMGPPDLAILGSGPSQQALVLHVLLNAVVVVIGAPLAAHIVKLGEALVPPTPQVPDDAVSALDPAARAVPRLALACAQREVLRMAETVQAMLVPVMSLFRAWNPESASLIQHREDLIDRMHYETKIYIAGLREGDMTRDEARRSMELVNLANSLEEAADRIASNLVSLARKLSDEGISFSDEGLADIEQFHDQVVANTQLALSVLTTGDAEAARQLVAEKEWLRQEEQKLQERHIQRLKPGQGDSFTSTNIHQETLRILKQVNAAICYVAYPIAKETGDLLESRLARPEFAGGEA